MAIGRPANGHSMASGNWRSKGHCMASGGPARGHRVASERPLHGQLMAIRWPVMASEWPANSQRRGSE
eukprot:3129188-Lingulodinium_polyedra.AAC.1